MLSSKLELDKLADDALRNLLEIMHAVAGAIIIEKDGQLQLLSSLGFQKLISQVFDKKRVCLEFASDIQINGLLLDFRPRHVIAEPVLYKGVVLGVILLAGDKAFISEETSDIELYSQGLSLALKKRCNP